MSRILIRVYHGERMAEHARPSKAKGKRMRQAYAAELDSEIKLVRVSEDAARKLFTPQHVHWRPAPLLTPNPACPVPCIPSRRPPPLSSSDGEKPLNSHHTVAASGPSGRRRRAPWPGLARGRLFSGRLQGLEVGRLQSQFTEWTGARGSKWIRVDWGGSEPGGGPIHPDPAWITPIGPGD